ncbi:hypothetical protein DFH09DRAFT_1346827 [Mycena vulgaris]|nr:hypothetical protein DFH09DRAFT_1346827 [Mycena vulgaris]
MAGLPSTLETTLAHGDLAFLLLFFRTWDPSTIFLLSCLNYRLRSLVHCYASNTWSVPRFLRQWFGRPREALKFLEDAPAIICGPAVLEFFDRRSPSVTQLDICVDFGGFVEAGKFLTGNGYDFRPFGIQSIKDFDLVALVEAARLPENQFKLHGERSVTQEEHYSRTFRFVKRARGQLLRVVVVHLVRCELHRFIFAMHSTAFMNYITSRWAISTFPRTTFLKRVSFVACQERFPGVDAGMTEADNWLRGYSSPSGQFVVVGAVDEVNPDAEIGVRWIGDERCWTIKCSWDANPLHVKDEVEGAAAFSVEDMVISQDRSGVIVVGLH